MRPNYTTALPQPIDADGTAISRAPEIFLPDYVLACKCAGFESISFNSDAGR
jgi:hypothetical protein